MKKTKKNATEAQGEEKPKRSLAALFIKNKTANNPDSIEFERENLKSSEREAKKLKRALYLKRYDSVTKRTLITAAAVLAILLVFRVLGSFETALSPIISIFKTLLTSFLLAFVLSVILHPLFELLGKMRIRNKSVRVIIIFAVIFGALACLIIFVVVPRISHFISTAIADAKVMLPNVREFILNTFKYDIYELKIGDILNTITPAQIIDKVKGIFGGVLHIGVVLMTTMVFSFFMIKDRDIVLRGIGRVVPEKFKRHYNNITNAFQKVFRCYIRGQFLVILCLGLAATVCFTVVGLIFNKTHFLAYAPLFGLIFGFMDIIPYIGPWIGTIVPTVYALAIGPNWPLAITIVVIAIVLQLLENHVLQPAIQGSQLEVHPLAVFVSTIVFSTLFGLVGIILAAPLAGMIKAIYSYIIGERENALDAIEAQARIDAQGSEEAVPDTGQSSDPEQTEPTQKSNTGGET